MADEPTGILKDVILGEIGGKNAAIHAYDGIIWKIRTGFPTLMFGGWAILLQGLGKEQLTPNRLPILVAAMFLITVGLCLSGWFVDRSYTRRKFRVILALNELTRAVAEGGDDLRSIPYPLLTVAGDDGNREFRCKGYQQAVTTGAVVFFGPVIPLAIALYPLVAWWR